MKRIAFCYLQHARLPARHVAVQVCAVTPIDVHLDLEVGEFRVDTINASILRRR